MFTDLEAAARRQSKAFCSNSFAVVTVSRLCFPFSLSFSSRLLLHVYASQGKGFVSRVGERQNDAHLPFMCTHAPDGEPNVTESLGGLGR